MNQSDSGQDPFCSSCHRRLGTAGSVDGECLACWETAESQQGLQEFLNDSDHWETLLD